MEKMLIMQIKRILCLQQLFVNNTKIKEMVLGYLKIIIWFSKETVRVTDEFFRTSSLLHLHLTLKRKHCIS